MLGRGTSYSHLFSGERSAPKTHSPAFATRTPADKRNWSSRRQAAHTLHPHDFIMSLPRQGLPTPPPVGATRATVTSNLSPRAGHRPNEAFATRAPGSSIKNAAPIHPARRSQNRRSFDSESERTLQEAISELLQRAPPPPNLVLGPPVYRRFMHADRHPSWSTGRPSIAKPGPS